MMVFQSVCYSMAATTVVNGCTRIPYNPLIYAPLSATTLDPAKLR